jgi:hypothetical protein
MGLNSSRDTTWCGLSAMSSFLSLLFPLTSSEAGFERASRCLFASWSEVRRGKGKTVLTEADASRYLEARHSNAVRLRRVRVMVYATMT